MNVTHNLLILMTREWYHSTPNSHFTVLKWVSILCIYTEAVSKGLAGATTMTIVCGYNRSFSEPARDMSARKEVHHRTPRDADNATVSLSRESEWNPLRLCTDSDLSCFLFGDRLSKASCSRFANIGPIRPRVVPFDS